MPAAKKKPLWTRTATQDLREIWRYYARVASVEVADKLIADFLAGGDKIAARPLTWRPREDLAPGLRAFRVRSYGLFYRVVRGDPEILRVLHERRDLAAIFKKMQDTSS
jgi:plasmid stabilization system protein ParE